jgi:hypothetical protein
MPLPKEEEITNKLEIEIEDESVKVEVEDDTPEEDRGREPLPENIVQELEADELEDYSEKVKTRLKQMKKVWHDERRAKEAALREQQEALRLAQQAIEENKKLKAKVSFSETALVSSYREAAARGLDEAKREFKEAYDSGDSDRITEAQEKLTSAKMRAEQADRFRPPPLQKQETVVNNQPEQVVPKPDSKAAAWQERNTWFGPNKLMTALALGLHEELVENHGMAYATTDEYYDRIDKTMRKYFPEEFKETQAGGGKPSQRTENKPATVVAPASRSTAPKKVVLKQSQLAIAKKLGLTPEQYAREYAKTLEN